MNDHSLIWRCFTKDTLLEDAYRMFEQRHGYVPDRHFYQYWLLWVGPIKRLFTNKWKEDVDEPE